MSLANLRIDFHEARKLKTQPATQHYQGFFQQCRAPLPNDFKPTSSSSSSSLWQHTNMSPHLPQEMVSENLTEKREACH